MASFVRPVKPPPVSWTVGERALYDARREFELLKLLATDKRAFNTARRLAVPLGQNPSKKQAAESVAAGARATAPATAHRSRFEERAAARQQQQQATKAQNISA